VGNKHFSKKVTAFACEADMNLEKKNKTFKEGKENEGNGKAELT